ncbi:single-stranded-DNA-specific exonuclease RecJ [Leptothoe spongobia]|uniref:Single-stranded-DNA-specific exonuclease RecJ n=1 Tax=Leptothoe spongobia TAU-MAC 1115 TaxID=1967444 RepID=A0A947DI87_9CYAN|nr:single-stranded-DNA-specific exonuclease RecJ [Leptothoe spongobia]MBT9317510.1 single-stranded-DNA-specific exonuclease RecJ [Leptothoe spongobia TAU-MAC 1115]
MTETPATSLATQESAATRIPQQRWQIFPPQVQQAQRMATVTQLSPLIAQVLINRGIQTPEQAWLYLDPETQQLPSPLDEFQDLAQSVEFLVTAIEQGHKIAVCGDYDADGMTSTALLLRALWLLGAEAHYAIPSRMQEGYGINTRIVEEFYADGVRLILTVDNGIAAYEPIARAVELGLTVIITDHHDLPEKLPPAQAILNPKLLPTSSPYYGVAGVGVAYILAVCLAQALQRTQDLTASSLELFTLGTIADLAPLVGVNRRWVRRGLQLLPKSRIPGIQALIEVAGLDQGKKTLKPEAIGFRLGPRINAIGRIGDPQVVIDMLTTEDVGIALQRAMQCEETNTLRQRMCELIETQAVAWCEEQQSQAKLDLQKQRVLVIVQPEWHHGVIGIVASRLVERYGVPVFIGTYEDKGKKEIRGSARGIPEFNVFEALQACDDLLDKYGGHRAAGGFTFAAKKLRQVTSRLSHFACQHLQPEYLKPLITVDARAHLADITLSLYEQIDCLHPCGIQNNEPVFWTSMVNVVDQQIIGKDRKHLKLTLAHTHPETQQVTSIKALAWRWAEYHPLPHQVDIAYKIRLNEWQGRQSIEIELVGIKLAQPDLTASSIPPWSVTNGPVISPEVDHHENLSSPKVADKLTVQPQRQAVTPNQPELPRQPELPSVNGHSPKVAESPPSLDAVPLSSESVQSSADSSAIHAEFFYSKRRYVSTIEQESASQELKIRNGEGQLLVVQLAQRRGVLYIPGENPDVVDLSDTYYFNLLRAGLNALELKQKTSLLIHKDELLAEKDELLSDKDSQIATLNQQIQILEDKITQLSDEKQTAFQELQTELQQQQAAIADQEAHIVQLQTERPQRTVPPPESNEIKQEVREALGDSVWFCIQSDSQKDFCAAYRNYHMLQSDGADPDIADYSEAGIRLSFAVEREVVQPFFMDLYDFVRLEGMSELGGIELGPNRRYTLGMMPSLLAEKWRTLDRDVLTQQEAVPEKRLYRTIKAHNVLSSRDRDLLTEFFEQWEHPMAMCFEAKGKQAAASLDQISRLRNIAAHGESFLYEWHYTLLRQLVVGGANRRGLFRQIYGG